MSRDEIRSVIAEILEDVAGVNREDVKDEAMFIEDLDLDSLAMVEVVVVLGEKVGVRIPDETVPELRTVGDMVSHIEAHAVSGV